MAHRAMSPNIAGSAFVRLRVRIDLLQEFRREQRDEPRQNLLHPWPIRARLAQHQSLLRRERVHELSHDLRTQLSAAVEDGWTRPCSGKLDFHRFSLSRVTIRPE